MAVEEIRARIQSQFAKFELAVTPAQLDQLAAYFGLLTKWNRTVNLTSLPLDPPTDQALNRLLVEPFLAARALTLQERPDDGLLLDIGSGGGSPAIPLRIALGDVRLAMVESRSRKSAFLREAVRHVGLAEADVYTHRLEELLQVPALREAASLLSVRAVKADWRFWGTASVFLKPHGHVLWFGSDVDRSSPTDVRLFTLDRVEPLIPSERSQLAILRKR